MADYKSKKAGNHLGRAWRGAARRGGRLYQGQVPGTTPCRHHLSEDKFLRPARNSTWCRRSGCRCVSRAAGTPAAWKASECLVEDHLWRSSGARGGATVHVYIGHRSTPIDRPDRVSSRRPSRFSPRIYANVSRTIALPSMRAPLLSGTYSLSPSSLHPLSSISRVVK